MYKCKKCNSTNYKWSAERNFKTGKKIITFSCRCGNTFSFSEDFDKDKIEAVAEYEIRNGKRFLRIDGIFKEVEFKKVKGGMQVVAIEN